MADWRRPTLRHALLVACALVVPGGASRIQADPAPQRSSAPPADGGACRFDLTGEKADRVFFLLGMRMEHGGRGFPPPHDQVDAFYCNERDAFAVFTRVVAGLVREQGLANDVRDETKQACLSFSYSPSLAAGFNACYAPRATGLALALFAPPGASVANNTIAPGDLVRRRALAYIAGAWARYRHDRAMVFTAGTPKADLLATLLKALGCANVRVETRLEASPGSNTVHFDPTPEVAEWLRKRW
jgi:hypothetical protein